MTRRDNLLLFVSILPCAVVAAGALFVVPQFREVFVNFGATLPFATRLLLATFHWWGVSVIATLAVRALWPTQSDRNAAAVVFGSVTAAILFIFGVYACYAPIFQLAAVVG